MIQTKDTIFKQPFFFISFSLFNSENAEVQFQTLFSNESGSLKHYLENEMIGLRHLGWNLPKYIQYSVLLDSLEYKDESRRVKVIENGHIIIQGAVSESFLCWASSATISGTKGDRIQINTTALVEFTYNCVALLKRAAEDSLNPVTIDCKFGFIGLDSSYVLSSTKLSGNSLRYIDKKLEAIKTETEESISINILKLSDNESESRITYEILAKIMRMFGYTEESISYTHETEKKIDIELIKNL